MSLVDFMSLLPKGTPPDYFSRPFDMLRPEKMRRASMYDFDYWDGDRQHGFGGFRYDERWIKVAKAMADHYNLRAGSTVLDVGCGRAFLLYELSRVVPGLIVAGVDGSRYSVATAKPEVRHCLVQAKAENLPFPDGSFDLVLCLNTLHNLNCRNLEKALRELSRVSRGQSYVTVESYRNETEKVRLLAWSLTGVGYYGTDDWLWWFAKANFSGDYSFIFFESD